MELIATTVFLAGLIMLIIILAPLLRYKSMAASSSRRPPPGPCPLPLIGSIHHLLTSQPQAALRDLARKHGPVMRLRLGQVDAVVISSPAAAREALRDKDASLASRPSLLGSEVICYGGLDIAFAPYGGYWRALRRLCTAELLSAGKVRRRAAVRDSETMSLVREIRAAAAGEPVVDLGGMLLSCTNSITGMAAFGDRCSGELRRDFMAAIKVVIGNISGFCVSDLFPSLRFVDVLTGTKRRLRRAHRQLEDVFGRIISEGEARREERKKKKATDAGGEEDDDDDLLSVLLRIRDEGQFEIPIGDTNIKGIILDMFTAGTETTSSVAEWLMAELIRNPDAMHKAQEEVRQAFRHRSPHEHESQIDKLHYTRLVIREALRLYPPLPLLLPRLCRETCDVGGFEVAKGSRVIVNAWAIARSPEHWDDADKFMPERFENTAAADYRVTQFDFLSFGHGRRICPGIGFGLSILEILVARLLYYFDWKLPDGMQVEDLDMEMTVGAAARRTNQLRLVAEPYYQVPMEI